MKTPIEEEVEIISQNPSRYKIDDFPPAATQDIINRAYRYEARRQVALNWNEIFSTRLIQWAEEKNLSAVISDDRYARYTERDRQGDGPPLITLFMGREEQEALRYYTELTHMTGNFMFRMDEAGRERMRSWKLDFIYAGVGIVCVMQQSYWRFV